MTEIEKIDRQKNIIQWVILFLFGIGLGYLWGAYMTASNLKDSGEGPTIYYPEQMPKTSPSQKEDPLLLFS